MSFRCPILLLGLLVGCVPLIGQEQNSIHGWSLSPHGTIRVLVIFAEIEYDRNPGNDPQPQGGVHWPKGGLPVWKDDLLDPLPLAVPHGEVTRYYHDISLGGYRVLGDHLDRVVTIKESEARQSKGGYSLSAAAIQAANASGVFRTAHGLSIADFDLWKDGGKPGLPKPEGPDDPHSFDHVMTIVRNSTVLTHGQGSTDSGSSGKLFGHESDTQSRFGAMFGLPFEILKHEFNHLLIGGNNFHSGGGNGSPFESFFIGVQGGWSMMGAANSSLLTCNAWDRDRMGWMPDGSAFRIRARDRSGKEVDGDIAPLTGDTGIYVLRDFVTTGDALRIRMPFLEAGAFPQWTWFENHQGWRRNGSPTDRFHYEDVMPCVSGIQPGLFAFQQVDRGDRTGTDIYKGFADNLRAIPATGRHDWEVSWDTVTFGCLWPGPTVPLRQRSALANPLTGWHELEIPEFDRNGDGTITRGKGGITPRILEKDGHIVDAGSFFCHADHAFTPAGNSKLGLATNPALVNMITLVSTPGRDKYKAAAPNDRVVHLTGISVQVLEQRADGALVLRVRSDDTVVDGAVRWCGDSIVLHRTGAAHGEALRIATGGSLRIARSRTPSRLDRPERVEGHAVFSGPTNFVVEAAARVVLDRSARMEVAEGSVVTFQEGATLELRPGARLDIERGSRVVMAHGAELRAGHAQVRKLVRKGLLVQQ